METLTKAMCWEVVSITNDSVNGVGIAVYRKPTSNDCYEQRSKNDPPLCQKSDDPNAAWYASHSLSYLRASSLVVISLAQLLVLEQIFLVT